jgi:ABC-type nitrate/sulfonate/bicarbonate transport system substrate-binding protein
MGTAAATGAAASLPLRARAATPFKTQAAWINDAEFAGDFLGTDEGYYAEEGLDLTCLPGGPDVIPERTILAGRADLALTTPDTTIKAIVDQGAPFKIIGAQYDQTREHSRSVCKTL